MKSQHQNDPNKSEAPIPSKQMNESRATATSGSTNSMQNDAGPAPKATAAGQAEGVSSPLSDLAFDWVTVLQEKARGFNAYDAYLQDARAAGATQCVEFFHRLQRDDAQQIRAIKDHVLMVLDKGKDQSISNALKSNSGAQDDLH